MWCHPFGRLFFAISRCDAIWKPQQFGATATAWRNPALQSDHYDLSCLMMIIGPRWTPVTDLPWAVLSHGIQSRIQSRILWDHGWALRKLFSERVCILMSSTTKKWMHVLDCIYPVGLHVAPARSVGGLKNKERIVAIKQGDAATFFLRVQSISRMLTEQERNKKYEENQKRID